MSDDGTLTEEDIQNFLDRNPSTLPEFICTFRGFVDVATRDAILGLMRGLADLVSRLIPLDGLDGITIAYDYRAALAELDRGVKTEEVLKPTKEDFGTGVAMSVGVIRDGQAKTHVTLEAGIALGLISDDLAISDLCKHTFVHELGHVAEQGLANKAFGEVMLQPFADRYENTLYYYSHACWGEYYASRVSADWGADAAGRFQDLFICALEQLDRSIAESRKSIGLFARTQNDVAARTVIEQVSAVMKYAGYVIGHARGREEPPVIGTAAEPLLRRLGLGDWFATLEKELDEIFDSAGAWTNISVFYPLHRAFEEACCQFKVELHRSDNYALAWRIRF